MKIIPMIGLLSILAVAPAIAQSPKMDTPQMAQKTAAGGDIAALKGKWVVNFTCGGSKSENSRMEVTSDEWAIQVDIGSERFWLEGKIYKDGTLSAFGNGEWLDAEIKGKIIDWRKGTAKGSVIGSGEENCTGT